MALKKVALPLVGEVILQKNRRSRHIRIKVVSKQSIRVTLPYWAPYSAAIKFINSQIDWIVDQQQHFSSLIDKQPIGKAHHLHFQHDSKTQLPRARINHTEILITLPEDMLSNDPMAQSTARRACIRALQREAQNLLPQRLRLLADNHSFAYQKVNTRHLKSRWGSCNQDNEISLNIFLMQLPWQLIDYVLLHELAHTRVHNHSPEYWDVLRQNLPNAKQLRREMRKYHPDF
ncbi:MAG: SprT family zinc-dependent metalloprotease [Candidatus Saccharimonadales bacterium]